MSCCKNCGIEITSVRERAFIRLNAQIKALRELLEKLEIRKKSQEQGFCDEFCEQRYHGDL